jgi:hypothetical protein
MEHLIARLPDEGAVRELVRLLRELPQDDALGVMRKMLDDGSRPRRIAGLTVARKVLRSNEEGLLQLLDIGLARKDVSEVRYWFDMATPALGYRRILMHLREVALVNPEWIVHAWYQLAPLVHKDAAGLVGKLGQLRDATEAALKDKPEDLKALWSRTKLAVG